MPLYEMTSEAFLFVNKFYNLIPAEVDIVECRA